MAGIPQRRCLFQIQTILSEKPEVADFSKVADLLGTSREELESEWKILRRLQGDLSTQDALVMLATSPEKCAMFPVFSAAIYGFSCCLLAPPVWNDRFRR